MEIVFSRALIKLNTSSSGWEVFQVFGRQLRSFRGVVLGCSWWFSLRTPASPWEGTGWGAQRPVCASFWVADRRSLPLPTRQVQNKLDGCCYAVKRIPINPASKHFRRIKGEVTLLSRLHHENIVRYYNAWIERHERPAGPGTPPPDAGPQAQDGRALPQPPAGDNDANGPGSVEAAAPPPILSSSVEWSTSGERSASARFPAAGQGSSSDEDDDEDEHDGVFSQSFL